MRKESVGGGVRHQGSWYSVYPFDYGLLCPNTSESMCCHVFGMIRLCKSLLELLQLRLRRNTPLTTKTHYTIPLHCGMEM